MRKEKPPPVNAPMLDNNGNLNVQWRQWFQIVGKYFDNYRRVPDLTFTGNATLTTDDFGKIIILNNGTASVQCNLPTVSSRDVHCWIGPIYRLGTGQVIITADGNSKIEYSSPGGSLSCNEPKRSAANVTLELVAENQWAIVGAMGIWAVG